MEVATGHKSAHAANRAIKSPQASFQLVNGGWLDVIWLVDNYHVLNSAVCVALNLTEPGIWQGFIGQQTGGNVRCFV